MARKVPQHLLKGPEPCWFIRSVDNVGSIGIERSILVFSSAQKLLEFTQGRDYIFLRYESWDDFAAAAGETYLTAIVDYKGSSRSSRLIML